MDHDLARVREIFDELIEAPPEGRSALLAERCGDDTALKRRVEALIATAESDDPFLSQPTRSRVTASTVELPPLAERPGTRIGPYKLLQEIGEGGFGVVFMAEQDQPVRRRVALKIIKLGMDTRQVVARFEQERQALALMDHPNIAKVLDAGATESGRPYFVMEYVKGDPITAFADAHKLSLPDRLELFAQVCAAVQHAHTKGVLHRDLKPRNVLASMSDGRPFAKVIDFGIAKATGARLTDKTLFTEHRQLIGTPEYMSPEQAEGSPDIDTRTDVYSLGVLLYELLTGATPFDAQRLRSAAYAEMQRIIKEEDPPAPSLRLSRGLETLAAAAAARQTEPARLGSLVKGELDWIVMKSLDKDRARRYESPNQLAADVRRHISGEAVEAAPPSTIYRFRKFMRRHQASALAATAVSAALLLGTAGTSIGMWRASHAYRTADENRRQLEAANATLIQQRDRARLSGAAAEYARWTWYEDPSTWGTDARRAFEAIVSTRTELLGPEHIDTIKARWMLTVARRDDGIGDDAAWWRATDADFTVLANCLERAAGHADAELSDWYGRALHFAFVRLDPEATMLWAGRCARAMTEILKTDGLNAACVPYRRLADILPVSHANEITAPMIDDMASRVANLTRAEVLEMMALITREQYDALATAANDCLAASPGDPHAHTALAIAYLGMHMPDEAMRTAAIAASQRAKAGLAESPADAAVVAMCMQRLGRVDEARAELTRARALAQADPTRPCADFLAQADALIDPQPTPEQRLAEEARARQAAEYRENISVASMAIAVGDVATARNRLDACDPESRGWEWHYLTGRSDTSVRVLEDGAECVYSIALSPDGTRAATGYRGGRRDARVWDVASGKLLATLPAEGGSNIVDFSPDGAHLLVCGLDSAVVWDIAEQHAVVTLPVARSASPEGMFSPDGARILTWEWAKPPHVWDSRTGALIATIPLAMDDDKAKDGLSDAAFLADGTRVVTGHIDHAKIWDVATGSLLHTLACEDEQAREIEASPDGRSIIGFGFNSKVIVWDAATGGVRATLVIQHDGGLVDAAFSRDGSLIVTSGYGRGVQVWNANTGALVRDLAIERPEGGHFGRFSPNATRLVVWGVGTPAVFETATGEKVRDLVGDAGDVMEAHFSPDGSSIVTASDDGTARLWNTEARPNPRVLHAHNDSVTSLQFSADGQHLLSATSNQWRLWDAQTWQSGACFTGPPNDYFLGYDRKASMLPDGRILSWINAAEIFEPADAGVSLTIAPPSERIHDGDLRGLPSNPIRTASVGGVRVLTATRDGFSITDATTGAVVLTKEVPGSSFAELSPDGSRALAVIFRDSIVRVFDVATGKAVFDLPGQVAKFDPSGTRILTLSRNNRGARVWDARTGQPVCVLDLPPGQWNGNATKWEYEHLSSPYNRTCCFSPDGAHVIVPAGVGWDADVEQISHAYVYDVCTGKRLAKLQSDVGDYCRIAYSPDGTRIATCRWVDPDGGGSIRDAGIRILDADSGSQLLQLPVPSKDGYGITSVAWSPDGTRLAAGGYDGQVTIFEVSSPTKPGWHP
ncbi:MAG: protein kinase [Tepidisphaera sp.]|nr:protein kinase [Tepidisphaera sp.]